jgi:thioredoxin 1
MSIQLNAEQFKDRVFDYKNNREWNYKGDLPAIIDFYADWCGPCKMVSPILDDLSKEYEGKMYVYKVNTDEEVELASVFGIQSIPSLLFIPVNDEPRMALGALPKQQIVKIMNEVLNVQ